MDKAKLFNLLRILFSIFLLALLFWLMRGNFKRILAILSSVNIPIFLSAFLLFMCSVFLLSYRLKIALTAQKAHLSLAEVYPLTLIGYFFTNFMPTSIGGDIVKGYYISQKTKSKISSYASVFVDRVIGVFSMTLIAALALVAMRQRIAEYRFIFFAVMGLMLVCLIFVLFVFNRELLKKISQRLGMVGILKRLKLDLMAQKAYAAVSAYTGHRKKVLRMFILSVISQYVVFSAILFLARSLSLEIPMKEILLVMPIIFVLCMLPVTVNGLGLREWAFVFLLGNNIGQAAALSLSLLYLAMFLLASLVGGIIYLFWR